MTYRVNPTHLHNPRTGIGRTFGHSDEPHGVPETSRFYQHRVPARTGRTTYSRIKQHRYEPPSFKPRTIVSYCREAALITSRRPHRTNSAHEKSTDVTRTQR